MPFHLYKQLNAMDCGPTRLRMVAKYYGKHYNTDTLRQKTGFTKRGVSLLGISETAEKLGFRSRGVKLTFNQLKEIELPCILHWNQNHFVVLLPFSGRRRGRGMRLKVADPAKGMLTYSKEEFMSHWISIMTKFVRHEFRLYEVTGSFSNRFFDLTSIIYKCFLNVVNLLVSCLKQKSKR